MFAIIVEPEPHAGALVRSTLREIGCTPVVFSTAEEALCSARARQAEIDLIVLSLELPDTDGLQTTRRLAALLTGVPIITCSSCTDEDVITAAFAAGAHDFVGKPLRRGELAVRAKAALRVRDERLRRARHEQRLVDWARQLEKSKRDLESAVCIDPLTGIANRRHLDSLLRAEWRRAARDGDPLSVVLIDVDEFHAFNERYGHVGGDGCLARIANALAHTLRRASDVLARYGGEEFVAVLPNTDAAGACVVAERLRARVEELQISHAGSSCGQVLTISAGVATRIPTSSTSPEDLVQAADAALFRAKREGRNCCRAEGVDARTVSVQRQPWPTCPVVMLDPILVQRVPRFLESSRDDLDTLRGASLVDVGRGRSVATRIRRAAKSLGFDELAEIATRTEAQIGAAPDAARAHIDELVWYVEHVRVVYRKSALRAV